MNSKKTINWTEIEARYIAGELPRHIAEDYENLTPKMVTNRASYKQWRKLKQDNTKKVIETVLQKQQEALEELCTLTRHVYLQFIKRLSDPEIMTTLTKPILLKDEKINSLFQVMLNNVTRIFLTFSKTDVVSLEEEMEAVTGPFGVLGLDEDQI